MTMQDQSHCTATGFNTLENRSKPLVFKELRKLWEKLEPDLPFERGYYDETNTLLLDDTPYKALRNPVSLDDDLIFNLIKIFNIYLHFVYTALLTVSDFLSKILTVFLL